MNIHVATRKAVAAVALTAASVAGFGTIAVGSANAASATQHKVGPAAFCSVVGGKVPIVGRLPHCKKKVEEIPGGPITVPIER